MANAQDWLVENFELPDYNGITEKSRTLNISHLGNISGNWLEGDLEIRDFPQLQTINLPFNSIISLKIVNCPELRAVNLMHNKLTSFSADLESSKNLRELNLANNDLCEITDISLGVNFVLEEVDLMDNKISAQNLQEIISKFVDFKKTKSLKLGCSESGARRGKRNNFFGSISFLYISESRNKQLKLDISGTDINEGLEELVNHHWGKVSLDCKPRREGDKVKELYDQLGQPVNGITLDKNTYESLLKNNREQQEEVRKWQVVKNAYTNILDNLNNANVWGAVDWYDQALNFEYPNNDNVPEEINELFADISLKTNSIIDSFFDDMDQGKIQKKDITDEQLNILEEKIIPFKERLVERWRRNNRMGEQDYQEAKKFFEEGRQYIKQEKNRRANPSNSNDNSDPLLGNNRPTLSQNDPTNFPSERDQNGPSQPGSPGPQPTGPDNDRRQEVQFYRTSNKTTIK